jgi:CO/xanthine dehydrogenase FAD-binding subunit
VKAFAYVNPTTEKDAVAALKIDGVAVPIGGGQDLLARM